MIRNDVQLSSTNAKTLLVGNKALKLGVIPADQAK